MALTHKWAICMEPSGKAYVGAKTQPTFNPHKCWLGSEPNVH